ncbi:Copper homeostasis protein CutC [Luteitalea pratensis]|uniref:Copper homeostasis protein cutC homolog n=1 Tax=Luteitalea pratensis TaxID=1855912 RepID=A0A143PR25_LUTPR|nr:copper homeostasis protein CutC [Luteitalea pratensis]AMY11055.1 Copper homeostasis protein CutC [Luteitalea pratensis]
MTISTSPSDALEVITLSVEDGLAAEAGGATRLEVVRDIRADGLTPDVRVVEALLERVGIPLRVMIRPRNTFLVGDDTHRDEIADDAALFADLPVDVVTGYVRAAADGSAEIDEAALALVAERVPRARITVHRAIERISGDPTAALRRCPAVDRVLSGGGAGAWASRAGALVRLQAAIVPVRVIVGGGVSMEGIDVLAPCSSLRELHVGRLARTGESYGAPVDARIVATLRDRWLSRGR